ncbi:MAG: efflux RND transporter periplasmic adaptor subunit [Bacteroidetes bacterium]|nr:efflux RND transporter periplasmic adaptor subunit [Bacteroidota bacterium]
MKKAVYFSLFIVLAAGCAHEKPQETASAQKIKVNVARVITAPGANELTYSGTVEASQTIPLNFQTTGTVENVYVEAGDEVKKDQVLASLNDKDLQSIYSTMLSKFNQARDAYDRLKMVHDEGSLPEIKWVEMKTNLEQAQASLDLARNNLDKCKLVAPVSGMVGRRNIEPGQSSLSLVAAPIELVRIEKVLVKISVPENEINQIQKGKKAAILVAAVEGTRFEGVVTNISPVAELMSRTYTVKISVDNPRLVLKPGMVCDVSLNSGKGNPALIVPNGAVSKDSGGNKYVFVVSPDNAFVKKQVVTVGRYNVSGIEITGGLTEGQTVVTGGLEKLSDNSLIEM